MTPALLDVECHNGWMTSVGSTALTRIRFLESGVIQWAIFDNSYYIYHEPTDTG